MGAGANFGDNISVSEISYRVNIFFYATSCSDFRIDGKNGIFINILDVKFPVLSKFVFYR